MELTPEEKAVLLTLIKNHRKTTMNNRDQTKDRNKDYLYNHTAAILDQLQDKLQKG